MNNEEAKRILALYRPDTADRYDPAFVLALEKTAPFSSGNTDPELAVWFPAHCAGYHSVKSKFDQIPIPDGLREKILAQAPPPPSRILPLPSMMIWRAAAILIFCLGLAALVLAHYRPEIEFSRYRSQVMQVALKPYSMDLESRDLEKIKNFLAGQKSPANYVLPAGMTKARPAGCSILHWKDQPVSMLCFESGLPMYAGAKSDLWLFIIDQPVLPSAPAATEPLLGEYKGLTTATWLRDGKTYILASVGDDTFIRKYF